MLLLLDVLLEQPIVNLPGVAARLGVTATTASRLVRRAQELDLVVEITGGRRNRLYLYEAYVQQFTDTAPHAG
jgi:Fic family protein